MATDNKGVIYYKLDPDYHYDGDYTKNCGLNGGEIDGNFHFLRGYDISEFEISENKEELVITRFNGDKLAVNIKENFAGYDFAYDKAAGVLKITMPYGETIDLEGFLTERIFHVYGDFTIDGDGTRYNPIRVASIAKTGTYRPAKTMLDLVDSDDALPEKNVALNDRYVTREKVSKYGLLYPLWGVDAIQKRLEEIGSEWRVPTKEDWDQLLNIVEDCPEDKNHESELTNKYFGANAGAYLKSVDQWNPYYRKLEEGEIVLNGERFSKDAQCNFVPNEDGEYLKVINSEDKYKFSVYPVGFGGRRGVDSIGGYGEWAAYWSSTEEDKNRDMYVKVFSYDERTVEQNTWGRDNYLSIRLVKNYTGENLYDVEMIDGMTVTTKHFVIANEEDKVKYDTTLIWTCENIGFSNLQYGGVVSPEWPDVEGTSFVIRYYVNDWDGEKWVKNEILEGESIVLFEENGVKLHEWRLMDGVLVDTLEATMEEVAKEFAAVDERLDALEEGLQKETDDRIAADEALQEAIEAETAAREEADKALQEAIDDEVQDRIAADLELQAQIDTLSDISAELEEKIDAETAAREEADKALQDAIDAEASAREEADKALQEAIEAEVKRAQDAEKQLQDNIDAEAETREEQDSELQEQIDENELVVDNSLDIRHGDADNGIPKTQLKVKLPVDGMIKVDENGLFIDGNFNVGEFAEWKIENNTEE